MRRRGNDISRKEIKQGGAKKENKGRRRKTEIKGNMVRRKQSNQVDRKKGNKVGRKDIKDYRK